MYKKKNSYRLIDYTIIVLFIILVFAIAGSPYTKTILHYNELCKISKDKKILIVQSYGPNHICSGPQEQGFLSAFKDVSGFYFYTFYMRTKYVYSSETEKMFRAKDAYDFYNQVDPEYVITMDDNAFKYFGIKYIVKDKKLLFTGVNTNPYNYKFPENRKPIIGVEELYDPDDLFKLFDFINYYPEMVYILYDDTLTSYNVAMFWRDIFINKAFDVKVRKVSTLEELNKLIIPKTALIIFNIQKLRSIKYHSYVTVEYLMKHIDKLFNTNVILVSNSERLKYGGSISVGSDLRNMGETIAMWIKEGKIKDMKKDYIIQSKPYISVRLRRLIQLNKVIPIEIIRGLDIHVY